MADDERLRSAVHDVLMAGGDVSGFVASWEVEKAQAQRVLDQVMADYVTELNRELASASGTLFGVDASTFMRQYDRLWQCKLSL